MLRIVRGKKWMKIARLLRDERERELHTNYDLHSHGSPLITSATVKMV